MIGETPILFLENPGVVSLDGIAFIVVPAVPLHGIDEEETEHLDPLRAQTLLLVEMLPNGPANHLPLDGKGIHVAPGLSRPEVLLAAGYAELHELVSPLDPNLADAAITVHGPLSVRDRRHPGRPLPGAYGPEPVARRNQANVGLVVGVLDYGRGHFDLLHQLAFVGIYRIQSVDHMVLVRVRCRVAQRAEGIHGAEGLLAMPLQTSIYTLRLVDNQDGARCLNEVDWLFAACLLAVLVEVVDILLVDGTDCHHHDLDLRAGGEIPHPAQFCGVVEEYSRKVLRSRVLGSVLR